MTMDGVAPLLVKFRDFAQMFATPISHSAPHLYLSALPFHKAVSPKPEHWLPSFPSTPIVHTQSARSDSGRILVNVAEQGKHLKLDFVADLLITVSPDGSKLAWCKGKTVQIANMQSGELVVSPIAGHSDLVTSVAFSPDSSRIVSGSRDQTIRVWDAQNGQAMLDPIRGHSNFVTSVAFSPDGSRIVSGSQDQTIRVWDAGNGQAMLDPIRGHSNWVTSVAFSPEGSRIVSGSDDQTIRIWDAQNGQAMLDPIKGHSNSVTSVAFSSEGSRIVSGS
jgi:WD40 repeat protein